MNTLFYKLSFVILFFFIIIISCSKDDSLSVDSEMLYLEKVSKENIIVSASIRSSYNDQKELERLLVLNYSDKELPEDIKISNCGYILESINERNDTIYKSSISNKIEITPRAFEGNIYSKIKPFLVLLHKSKRKQLFKFSNAIIIEPYFNYNVIINDIYPLKLTVNDTLKIRGKNFCLSGLKKETPSTINIFGYQHLIHYESDSLLTTIISPKITQQISKKTYLLNCGTTNHFEDQISIHQYELDSITQKKLFVGDTISFYGKNFIPELFSSDNSTNSKSYIKIGNETISVLTEVSNTKILKALIPKNLPPKEIDIEFSQLGNHTLFSKKHKSTSPYISDSTINIKYKDTVKIKGKWFSQNNLTDLNLNTNFRGVTQKSNILNDSVIEIIYSNSVPKDFEKINLDQKIQLTFKYKYLDLFKIKHDEISIEKPKIESYNKDLIAVNEKGEITLKNGSPYGITLNKAYNNNHFIKHENLSIKEEDDFSSFSFYISQNNIEGKTISGKVNTIFGDVPFEFKISPPQIKTFRLYGTEYVEFTGENIIPNSDIYVNDIKYNFDYKYSSTSSPNKNGNNFSVQSLGSNLYPGKNYIYTQYEDLKSNIYEFEIPAITINFFDYDGNDLIIRGNNLNTHQLQLFLDNVKLGAKFYSYDNLNIERNYAIYSSSVNGGTVSISARSKRLTLSEYPAIRYVYFSDTITLGKTIKPLKHTFSEKIINNSELRSQNILHRFEFKNEIYCITSSNMYKLNFDTKTWELHYSNFLGNKQLTSRKYIVQQNNLLHLYFNNTIYTFNIEDNRWIENKKELNLNKTIVSFSIDNTNLYFLTNESNKNLYSYNFETKVLKNLNIPVSLNKNVYRINEKLYIYNNNEKHIYILDLNSTEWSSIKFDEGTAASTYNYQYEATSIFEYNNEVQMFLVNTKSDSRHLCKYIENGHRFISISSIPETGLESFIIGERIFSFGGFHSWSREVNDKYYVTKTGY